MLEELVSPKWGSIDRQIRQIDAALDYELPVQIHVIEDTRKNDY